LDVILPQVHDERQLEHYFKVLDSEDPVDDRDQERNDSLQYDIVWPKSIVFLWVPWVQIAV